MPRAQTTLSFSPLPSSSPARAGLAEGVRDKAAFVRASGHSAAGFSHLSSGASSTRSTQTGRAVQQRLFEQSANPQPERSQRGPDRGLETTVTRIRSKQKPIRRHVSFSSSDEEEAVLRPAGEKAAIVLSDESNDSDGSGVSDKPLHSAQTSSQPLLSPAKRHHNEEREDKESEEGESEDVAVKRPRRSGRRTVDAVSNGKSCTGSGSDSDIVTSPIRSRRSRKNEISDNEEVPAPRRTVISDDDDTKSPADRPVSAANSRRRRTRVTLDSSEESGDVNSYTPARRRGLRQGRPSTPDPNHNPDSKDQEREDLDEDLANLNSNHTTPLRTRGPQVSTEKSRRQKQLQRLKNRRASKDGEKELTPSEDSEQYESEPPPGSGDDQDFVVEDDEAEDVLGAPTLESTGTALPWQFSRHAHKKLRDHFKDAVEWMIQAQINPAFERDMDVYRQAFRRLDTETEGYIHSKYTSSAWIEAFRSELLSRPDMHAVQTIAGFDSCQACNRSGHPATFTVTFAGEPYDLNSLEPESDGTEETQWQVGKHCMANAEMAHRLSHWRHQTHVWTVGWLEQVGELVDAEVLRRSRWTSRRRREYANELVDDMHASGELKRLWTYFKGVLDDARHIKG